MGRDTPTYDAAVDSTYGYAYTNHNPHNDPHYPRGKHARIYTDSIDVTYAYSAGTAGRTTDPNLHYGYTFHGSKRRAAAAHAGSNG